MKQLISVLMLVLCSISVFAAQAPRAALYDVRVDSIQILSPSPEINEPVQIRVMLSNYGDRMSNIILRLESEGAETVEIPVDMKGVKYQQVAIKPVNLEMIFANRGEHEITATIDATNQYHEGNENNNVRTTQVFVEGDYLVSGRITQMFSMEDINDESPISGAVVEINDVEATTDDDGDYSLYISEPGQYQVIITHPDYYQRVTWIEIDDDEVLDANLIPGVYPMEFFNEIARNSYTQGTQRWLEQPDWYIDTSSAEGTVILPTQQQIDFTTEIINNEIGSVTIGFFEDADISQGVGSTYGILGQNLFLWRDDLPGSGAHGEWIIDNEIISAFSAVGTATPLSGVYRQELAQTTGFRSDSNLIPSIFNDPGDITVFLYNDLLAGKILYSRPIGSTSPDTDPFSYANVRTSTLIVRATIGKDTIEQSFEIEKSKSQKIELNNEFRTFFQIPEDKKIFFDSKMKTIELKNSN